uniref:Superoxide dismutase [Cu-Zn]-like n=1 Tax=Saccoglossus kowalevskii TaxID=10224 RepID=A0ABM0MR10_SACKO|nr:PREDICTED: superoxide dismutase [Cu-Zn]-like [Saccoglossus kowalevskii]
MANIVAVLYVAFLIAGSAIGEVIAITYTGSTTSQTNAEATGYIYGGCYIRPNPSGINVALRKNIEGIIEIKQKSTGGEVEITLDLSGFNTNSHHGFHIHTYGYNDRGKGCSAAGGHYNPFSNVHGSPSDNERHVGDLGNIVSDENGNVKTVIRDSVVSLIEENSVIGRSFVVHAGTDDLGRGGQKLVVPLVTQVLV